VATLSSEAVGVLRVAAVIGREFDLHLLQQTTRLTPARLLNVLAQDWENNDQQGRLQQFGQNLAH